MTKYYLVMLFSCLFSLSSLAGYSRLFCSKNVNDLNSMLEKIEDFTSENCSYYSDSRFKCEQIVVSSPAFREKEPCVLITFSDYMTKGIVRDFYSKVLRSEYANHVREAAADMSKE